MGKLRITADEFAERVSKATDGRISIVKETYTGTRNKVTAFCNVHKIYFEVSRAKRLYELSANCPKCSKEHIQKQNEEKIIPFSKMLKRFHKSYEEKFSYDELSYHGRKKLMKVHCNVCGEDFEITPEHHLKYNNGGCPNCQKYRIIKCSCCGKEIVADYHINKNIKIYCDECKKRQKLISRQKNIKLSKNKEINKYCKICGRKLNKDLKCDNDFCNRHSIQQIKSLIKNFQFDENKLGTIEVECEFYRIRDLLYDMYWNKQMSSTQICEIFGYNDCGNLTQKVFKYLGIQSKTLRQSSIENIITGRTVIPINPNNYPFKKGYHTTWNNKDVYLRSSYEFDYAKELDEKHINYDVEEIRIEYFDTQKNLIRIAIPDFYLPDTNTIVEVKSKWTLNKQNMKDKRKEYLRLGYNFKLLYEHQFVELDDIEEYKHHL